MQQQRQYWILRQGKTVGPFSGQQLVSLAKSGMIEPEDMVSVDNVSWRKAVAVEELTRDSVPLPMPVVCQEAPTPSTATATTVEFECPACDRAIGPRESAPGQPPTRPHCESPVLVRRPEGIPVVSGTPQSSDGPKGHSGDGLRHQATDRRTAKATALLVMSCAPLIMGVRLIADAYWEGLTERTFLYKEKFLFGGCCLAVSLTFSLVAWLGLKLPWGKRLTAVACLLAVISILGCAVLPPENLSGLKRSGH